MLAEVVSVVGIEHIVLTLSPLPSAKRDLTLDDLQHLQLQHGVIDAQHAL